MDAELTTNREFWDRKVNKVIQMFEYGAFTEQKFVSEMSRLGYDRNEVKEALNDDDAAATHRSEILQQVEIDHDGWE
jgi:hypothetical protein